MINVSHTLFHLFLFNNLLLKPKLTEMAWPVGTCNLLYCSLASDVLGCTGQIIITVGVSWRQLEKDTTQ